MQRLTLVFLPTFNDQLKIEIIEQHVFVAIPYTSVREGQCSANGFLSDKSLFITQQKKLQTLLLAFFHQRRRKKLH